MRIPSADWQTRSSLVYAVDKVPEKAKKFADEFGCAWTTDFDEILDKDIDVVHLCLPHFLHPVMAIKAMKARYQRADRETHRHFPAGRRPDAGGSEGDRRKAGLHLPDPLHEECGKIKRNDPARRFQEKSSLPAPT